MGIEPMMLSHLLQPTTPYCVHLRAFSIDRHVNPLIAFGATSTTIEPYLMSFHQSPIYLSFCSKIGNFCSAIRTGLEPVSSSATLSDTNWGSSYLYSLLLYDSLILPYELAFCVYPSATWSYLMSFHQSLIIISRFCFSLYLGFCKCFRITRRALVHPL